MAAGTIFGIPPQLVLGGDAEKRELTNVKVIDSPMWEDLSRDLHDRLTVREVLQTFGVVMRQAFPECWINSVLCREYEDDVRFVLIPDLRFKDEAASIKALGGLRVKVQRLGVAQQDHDSHVSEHDLDEYHDWDRIFMASTIEDAGKHAAQFAQDLLGKRAGSNE